ncbi:MAG: hypothetical protein ACPGWR_20030 [Ardenticatenaceae bacterium]
MAKNERPPALEVLKEAIKSATILGGMLIIRQTIKDSAEIQMKAQAKAKAEAEAQLKVQALAETQTQIEAEAKAKAEAETNKPHWADRIALRLLQGGVAFGLGWLTHVHFDDPLLEKFVVALAGTMVTIGAFLYGKSSK